MENLFGKDFKQNEIPSGIEGCRLHYLEKTAPYASYFVGIWERHIRSFRAILAGLLECHDKDLGTESSARIRITKPSGDLSQKLTRPVNNLLLLLENQMV